MANHENKAAVQTVEVDEAYIGPTTICIIILCIIIFFPLAFIACLKPCDTRKVTKVVGPGLV
jgi:hypothetical protein